MYIIPNSEITLFVHQLTGKRRYRYASTFSSRTLTSITHLKQGIYNVYESGVPFQTGKQKYKVGNYRSILDSIAERVFDYFNRTPNTQNTQANFDSFHKTLCDDFLSAINTQRMGLGLADFTYGNAQKLINMYFKYLACYGDYASFASLFEYCHMPIDKFVLDGLRAIGVSNIKGSVKTSMKYCGKAWTTMDYTTYASLVDEYRRILRVHYSALYYDFCIWGKSSLIFSTSGTASIKIPTFYM